jgi:leader peptidase (prepilin peptidase)/N-methyltransferase
MTTVILFVFGVAIGSFLNVFALRYNSGLSLGGRSSCARCGAELRWYELVPVLSYLFLLGRCRHCRTKISPQYPLVELATGAVFATLPLAYLPVFSLYIAILVYDVRHKVIPDGLAYAAAALAAAATFLLASPTLLDWLAGPILFSLFGFLWLVSRGRAIGFGDAKLVLSIGLLLGAAEGFSAVIMAFWIGASWGVILLLSRRRNTTMKSELPFAPFLIAGAWAAAAFHLDLLHVSSFFS